MREIPKEILDRCEFKNSKQDSTLYLVKIKPEHPCECGLELDDIRRTRIQKTLEPAEHWREYCYTCKRVSILNQNDWHTAKELNAKMRKVIFSKHK